VADLVDETLRAIDVRIAELAPLVDEHGRLTKASQELRAVTNTRANRTNASGRAARANTRPRRRGGATWKQRFLAEVEKRPGATAAELAKRLKVDTRRLSTLGSQLKTTGEVKKKGRRFYPAGPIK